MSFLQHLLPRKSRSRRPLRSTTPFAPPAPLQPVWVIGDIHGCQTLLERVFDAITQETERRALQDVQVVAVGDYVDRGDNAAAVLETIQVQSRDLTGFHALLGNHEAMMLNFLDAPERHGARWLRYGGLQTLASFGIGGVGEGSDDAKLAQTAEALRAALPTGQEDWLRRLPTHWASGTLHVVHAGANPHKAMAEQSRDTLVWGHPDFDTVPRQDQQWVAFGHTITDSPGSDGQGRIATDTGAYYSGTLTAALITPEGEVSLVQT